MVTIYFHVNFIVVIFIEPDDVAPKQSNIKNEQMVKVFWYLNKWAIFDIYLKYWLV